MSISNERGVATINGARIAYEVAGAGHPLVLIHAGIADRRMWDDQFAAFAAEYRVVRYDLRGFGESALPPGPFTMRDDLRALLVHLGIARAHLIGVSMGGGIAIDFALDHPAMVARLIPVAAGIGGRGPSDALREQWAIIGEAADRGDWEVVNELELRLWIDGVGRTPEEVDPAVRERVREMNAAVIARESQETDAGPASPLDPPAIDRLGEIAAPTLVVVGARDVPHIVEGADILAARIPGARKVVLPDVAHLPPMETPAAFNRLVLDFLREG